MDTSELDSSEYNPTSTAKLADAESDATTSTSADDCQEKLTTFLDALRQPQPSILARKRRVSVNPSPKGLKKCKGKTANDPPSISLLERVRHYPEEPFCVSNKRLFCSSCREELPLKKSSIDAHVKSSKHTNS